MEISWTKLLGSSKTDKGNAIAFGSDGSIYIAGNTNGDLEDQINNGGYRDVFISKLDNNGDELWTKLLDGDGYEFPSGIVIGSDDSIYVTGRADGNLEGELNNTVGNVFVHKINSDGDKLWTRLLGTSSSGNSAIAIGSDDSLYLTGCTFEDLDGELNNGQGDIFITKLNSDGYKQWTKLSGGLDHEQGNGIAIGSDGSIYITGYTNGNLEGQINSNRFYAGFISNYNSDGVRQWTKFIEPALDTLIFVVIEFMRFL